MNRTMHDEGSFADDVRQWTMNHFSISDVAGTAKLLRKVADSLDQLGDVDVFDMTFKQDVDDRETITVYFAFPDASD